MDEVEICDFPGPKSGTCAPGFLGHFWSGVDAALLDGECYAVYGQHVCGDAVVHVVGFGIAHAFRIFLFCGGWLLALLIATVAVLRKGS